MRLEILYFIYTVIKSNSILQQTFHIITCRFAESDNTTVAVNLITYLVHLMFSIFMINVVQPTYESMMD